MRQLSAVIRVETRGRGLVEITDRVVGWLDQAKLRDGLLTLFVRHTSASLLIQENADPEVKRDLYEHRRAGHAREVALHLIGE